MKVIICVDGSNCSMAAVRFVMERPWHKDDQFFVVSVVELMPRDIGLGHVYGGKVMNDSQTLECTELANDCTEKIKSALPDNKVEPVVLHGAIVDEICNLAKEKEAGLILLGSHSRKGFEHFILGSVAEAVLRNAPCCVQVVKGEELAKVNK